MGLAVASGNGSRHRDTPASAAHRGIRVDPSQGTLEKIQLLPLPANDPFQASDFALKFFDPRIPPVRLGSASVVVRTPTQLALPSIKTAPVHTQITRKLADVLAQLHSPDSPLPELLRKSLRISRRPAPFKEKC